MVNWRNISIFIFKQSLIGFDESFKIQKFWLIFTIQDLQLYEQAFQVVLQQAHFVQPISL